VVTAAGYTTRLYLRRSGNPYNPGKSWRNILRLSDATKSSAGWAGRDGIPVPREGSEDRPPRRIKVVRQDFDSPEARQRFACEAQSAGTLRHPNIVTIFDVDDFQGLPFIAMEYVDGETLSEIVRRKAPFPIAKRLEWIEELCAGLAYAHRQGVVHRDIKPANLMLDNEGSLKILDFGLARREAPKFMQSQTVIGTPNYMSPEQIRAGDVGPSSDIFAVGCVLYEVLPFVEAFPGKVHQAMHKILSEEPAPIADWRPAGRRRLPRRQAALGQIRLRPIKPAAPPVTSTPVPTAPPASPAPRPEPAAPPAVRR
jgi:serine/threonine protein kinase